MSNSPLRPNENKLPLNEPFNRFSLNPALKPIFKGFN